MDICCSTGIKFPLCKWITFRYLPVVNDILLYPEKFVESEKKISSFIKNKIMRINIYYVYYGPGTKFIHLILTKLYEVRFIIYYPTF